MGEKNCAKTVWKLWKKKLSYKNDPVININYYQYCINIKSTIRQLGRVYIRGIYAASKQTRRVLHLFSSTGLCSNMSSGVECTFSLWRDLLCHQAPVLFLLLLRCMRQLVYLVRIMINQVCPPTTQRGCRANLYRISLRKAVVYLSYAMSGVKLVVRLCIYILVEGVRFFLLSSLN